MYGCVCPFIDPVSAVRQWSSQRFCLILLSFFPTLLLPVLSLCFSFFHHVLPFFYSSKSLLPTHPHLTLPSSPVLQPPSACEVLFVRTDSRLALNIHGDCQPVANTKAARRAPVESKPSPCSQAGGAEGHRCPSWAPWPTCLPPPHTEVRNRRGGQKD